MLRARMEQRMGGAGSDEHADGYRPDAEQRSQIGPKGMLRARREQRMGGAGSDGSDGDQRRRQMGAMALQAKFAPMTLQMPMGGGGGRRRGGGRSGTQNQAGFPAQSSHQTAQSSQQTWRAQDPNYVPASASNQQNWRPQNPNYVPSSSSSQQNWKPQDPNYIPSSYSSQHTWRTQDPKYGQTNSQP